MLRLVIWILSQLLLISPTVASQDNCIFDSLCAMANVRCNASLAGNYQHPFCNDYVHFSSVSIRGSFQGGVQLRRIKQNSLGHFLTSALSLRELGIEIVDAFAFDMMKGDLEDLNLEENRLTDLDENVFRGLNKLKALNLGLNMLTAVPTRAMKTLRRLTHLLLVSNKISGIKKGDFRGLSSLQYLDLSFNRVAHFPGESILQLHDIQVLHLQGNQFVCDCDLAWLRHIRRCLCTMNYDRCSSPAQLQMYRVVDYPEVNCTAPEMPSGCGDLASCRLKDAPGASIMMMTSDAGAGEFRDYDFVTGYTGPSLSSNPDVSPWQFPTDTADLYVRHEGVVVAYNFTGEGYEALKGSHHLSLAVLLPLAVAGVAVVLVVAVVTAIALRRMCRQCQWRPWSHSTSSFTDSDQVIYLNAPQTEETRDDL